MPNLQQRISDALAALQAGNAADAEARLRAILDDAPDQPEALYYLGLCRHQAGDSPDAVQCIARALPGLGHPPDARFNLALIQSAAHLHADAAATLQGLIDDGHRDIQIRNALGVTLRAAGRINEACTVFEGLVRDAPDFAGGLFNLGNLYLANGRARDAIDAFERAHAAAPTDTAIALNLAAAFQSVGDTDKAHKLLSALAASSPSADVLNNLGLVQRQRGERETARDTLLRALQIDPNHADAAYNLGSTLADLNQTDDAKESFKRADGLRSGFVKARWAGALALPQVYASEDHRAEARADFLQAFEDVLDTPVPDADIPAAFAAASELTPFALAYQGADDIGIMTRWGERISDVAKRALPDLAIPPTPTSGDKKRIGFVSAHFRAHTIQRLFGNWITGLDPDTFEVHLFSTSGPGDGTTRALAQHVDTAVTEAMGLEELARTIHGAACDVLIYPDIGMDPRTGVLAALPLAGRQAMAWGHPVTSGLPTMDAFFSADLMEPEGADPHYRERLERLPDLSVAMNRPARPSREAPTHDFLCAQSLFKIRPGQDAVFASIAKETGASISFIAHPIAAVTQAFRTRIEDDFKAAGLDPAKHIRFVPPCARDDFLAHLSGARVVLDTFHWSGGNTSLEAFAMGRPVVTMPGAFMRGRHTYAMLTMLGLNDLIVDNADEYIGIAQRLWADRTWRDDIESAIDARAPMLFDGTRAFCALNDFLRDF